MATALGLRMDLSPALAGLDRIEQRARDVAIPRALNRAAASARTFMARTVAKDMALNVGVVRDQIGIDKATATRPIAAVSVRGARLPLNAFGGRQTKRGVTANTGGGRQLYPSAFIARVTGPLPGGIVSPGHTGVFKRRGKTRLPIFQLYGASLPKVFTKYLPAAQEFGESQVAKNLAHELEFAASQLAGSGLA